MSLLSENSKDKIVLRKGNGNGADVRAMARFMSATTLAVPDKTFPVEVGDAIFREMPSGVVMTYTVEHVHFEAGIDGDDEDAYYKITVENLDRRPSPQPQVVHNTTYHVNQAAAVGHGATAIENTLVQHNTTQTLNVADPGLAEDLKKIKKALLVIAAENDEDHEAVEEAHKVDQAQKALKEGSSSGVVAALKTLRAKTWNVAQGLVLAYLDAKGREYLGLPPGGP